MFAIVVMIVWDILVAFNFMGVVNVDIIQRRKSIAIHLLEIKLGLN